jgi:transcriptional regulator with XRE-family HTH domain
MKNYKSNKDNNDDIGTRLKNIRFNARLTQKEMGDIVNMKPASIGALENGLYTPNYEVLRAIRKRLGVSYDYIIDGVESDINTSELIIKNKALEEEVARLSKVVDRLLK